MSQFEAHLRAILDLPLAPEDLRADRRAVMLNVLGGAEKGTHLLLAQRALSVPRAAVHLYGKGAGRPGRKMGHITVTAATMDEAERAISPLIALAGGIRAERLAPKAPSPTRERERERGGNGGNGGNGNSRRERERERERHTSAEPTSSASALLQSFAKGGATSKYPPQLQSPLSPPSSPTTTRATAAAPPPPPPISNTNVAAPALPAQPSAPAVDGPPVAVTMGSDSDLATLRPGIELLRQFGVPARTTITSAHRTPRRMLAFAEEAAARGVKVIIAGAGGAAHLPGMVAASTRLPVIGVPVKTSVLEGMDSLLSMVQMPVRVLSPPLCTAGVSRAT